MPWRERMNWSYATVVLVTFVAYAVLIALRAQNAPVEEVAYVVPLVLSIGVSIVATVVGTIVSTVVGAVRDPESAHELERSDERDEQIEHRGELVGYKTLSVFLMVPFGLTMAELPHFWIANAIYLSFSAAALISTAVKLIAYRRGF